MQILEALDYMHTRCQIIHTDLKPENVMLTEAIRPQRAALVAAARAGELTEACLPPASAPGLLTMRLQLSAERPSRQALESLSAVDMHDAPHPGLLAADYSLRLLHRPLIFQI